MIKNFKWLLLVSLTFVACSSDDEVGIDPNSSDGLPLTAGTADFSKYVSLGNSLTAGYSDGALFIAGQEGSYPSLLSQQFALVGGGEFKIPFINATHPNDRGIRESPQVYVANPTINTHIEFLQQQLSSKWPNANILWFRRTDPLDNRMEEAFRSANLKKGTKKLQYKTIALPYNFTTNDILPKLDTTKTNLVIAGSLDDKFAAEFLKTVREFPKKGLIVVVGMPNWESLKEMQLPKYAALPIYFSSPFYISPTNTWAKEMDELFKKNIYTKPSLPAYKGFELTYYFASLFSKHARVVVGDSTDNLFTPLNDLDFQPIKTKGPEGPVDYFENKKLYFLRRLNGVTISQ
jgi:hypothetical protein